jgi:hypothetical protein
MADRISGVSDLSSSKDSTACAVLVECRFTLGDTHTTPLLVLLVYLFPPLFLLSYLIILFLFSYLTIFFFSFSFLPANSTDKPTRNIATQTKLLLLKEEV